MIKRQLCKRFCTVIALILMSATGKADVISDWNAIMQAPSAVSRHHLDT